MAHAAHRTLKRASRRGARSPLRRLARSPAVSDASSRRGACSGTTPTTTRRRAARPRTSTSRWMSRSSPRWQRRHPSSTAPP
eukprot:4306891-Prymnesium_polylepis.2